MSLTIKGRLLDSYQSQRSIKPEDNQWNDSCIIILNKSMVLTIVYCSINLFVWTDDNKKSMNLFTVVMLSFTCVFLVASLFAHMT